MPDLVDPRLIEIEILSDADRALANGGPSYEYSKIGVIGPNERQHQEAIMGLLFEGALVGGTHYKATKLNYQRFPVPEDAQTPNPLFGIDEASLQGIKEFLGAKDIVPLRITQRGRLRLFRLRNEILQRDRIRDEFGILWAHRHWLPDLEVQLHFRTPPEAFSLIVLDVDHLRALNTDLGHHGADQVLAGIFETLRDVVQPHYGYRIGGDEAGAILPGVSHDEAHKLAEDVRRGVEARVWPDALPIKTKPTVSVGVGTYLKEARISGGALYDSVDKMAQAAKETRNKVVPGFVAEPTSA